MPDHLLRTDEQRLRRLALIDRPAMRPLETYRRAIAARFGLTPHADPLDGGCAARVLILVETPGPGIDTPRFVSRDNPTGTARNLRRFSRSAGLAREDTVLWNVVPWHVHAPGARNRALRRDEITRGLALLPDFLRLLTQLRVAILAGRVAGLAAPLFATIRPDIPLLRMPHPSPTFVNTSPEIAPRLIATLHEAAVMIAPR